MPPAAPNPREDALSHFIQCAETALAATTWDDLRVARVRLILAIDKLLFACREPASAFDPPRATLTLTVINGGKFSQ